jgi:hypothetical protein
MSAQMEKLAVVPCDHSAFGATEAESMAGDRVEYRLGVVRRGRDQAQDLGSGGLLLARGLERDRRLGFGCWFGSRRAAIERLAEPRVLRGELGLRWWPTPGAAGLLSWRKSHDGAAPADRR